MGAFGVVAALGPTDTGTLALRPARNWKVPCPGPHLGWVRALSLPVAILAEDSVTQAIDLQQLFAFNGPRPCVLGK